MTGRVGDESPTEGRLGARVVLQTSTPLAVERTAARIADGGVVSFPTDTVYALAAALSHPTAIARIMAIKRRPDGKPLPVLLASPDRLRHVADLAEDAGHLIAALASQFWPGPLTAIVPARPGLPAEVIGRDDRGRATVGVRVPAHALALDVIRQAGGSIAATSANRSGEPPACTASEVIAAVGPDIDILLDGGECPGGTASTVVSVGNSGLVVVREGPIGGERVERAWRELLDGAR